MLAKIFLRPEIKGISKGEGTMLAPSVIDRASRDGQASPLRFNATLVKIDYTEKQAWPATDLALDGTRVSNEQRISNRFHACSCAICLPFRIEVPE
jgi:hypothetical protein